MTKMRLRGPCGFHDDLLVRAPSGYKPTPQGKRVLQELEVMLPRLDRPRVDSDAAHGWLRATMRALGRSL
jgi:DNA-binding transcriptional LysR family regulator